jgi:hypothetical protein
MVLKYKLITKIGKLDKLRKCSFCHRKLSKEKIICQVWWVDTRLSETFRHKLHLSCFYKFLKELEKPEKEHREIIKILETKYPKEIIVGLLK